jgi:uncharacterized Rmd1/YagE family protein
MHHGFAASRQQSPPLGAFSALSFSSSSPTNDDSHNNKSNNKLPPHKQLIPPMPPRPSSVTVVEPPIRSRPFRPFRGARGSTTVQRHLQQQQAARRRVVVKSPSSTERYNSNHNKHPNYGSYPVQAIHVAQSIDLAQVISKVFATKGAKRMMERLSVVVQLPKVVRPLPSEEENEDQNDNHPQQLPRFVAVFRFGSVVFFNVSPRDVADVLYKIKKSCSTDPVLSGSERKENFCVHVQPEMPISDDDHGNNLNKVVTGEYCVVQELNMKSVDVISNVMAQSVALDSYNDMVDELLANFETINGKVVTGYGNSLTTVDRDKMFRAVARNNSIFIEMVSKVGIKDRSDTAWNLSQYEDIHDGMKEEFDIDQRFEHIEFKLNLIQQNAKFFLEVLAHQKSTSLEWIIIVLIGVECMLMCMEMSGVGHVFFGSLAGTLKALS